MDEPKLLETAGYKKIFATATGTICGQIINPSEEPIAVFIFAYLLPGMGRHLFSSVTKMRMGVITILRAGNPQMHFNKKTSPRLNQHGKHAGMCSFDLSLPAVDGETLAKTAMSGVTKTLAPGVALAAQVSADTWHRRLGHINPANMELLRKTEGNGVEYTGTVPGCYICAVGKSTQKTHPKKTKHKIDGPMEVVYTDLMGPIMTAARGGYKNVSKFTDDFSRMNEIFLL